jgi:hypothetical protein
VSDTTGADGEIEAGTRKLLAQSVSTVNALLPLSSISSSTLMRPGDVIMIEMREYFFVQCFFKFPKLISTVLITIDFLH